MAAREAQAFWMFAETCRRQCVASLGEWLSRMIIVLQEVDFQRVDGGQSGSKGSSGLLDVRRDLPKAVRAIVSGTPAQRKAAIQNLYAEVGFMDLSLHMHAIHSTGRLRTGRVLEVSYRQPAAPDLRIRKRVLHE